MTNQASLDALWAKRNSLYRDLDLIREEMAPLEKRKAAVDRQVRESMRDEAVLVGDALAVAYHEAVLRNDGTDHAAWVEMMAARYVATPFVVSDAAWQAEIEARAAELVVAEAARSPVVGGASALGAMITNCHCSGRGRIADAPCACPCGDAGRMP